MNNLAINDQVYFDCDKKQLKYISSKFNYAEEVYEDVDRYAIVRKDTGKVLGIHSDDYIVRPYAKLA